MITNKTFSTDSNGLRVISYWKGEELHAKIVRRSDKRTFDVFFEPSPGLLTGNVYGCKSKAEAESWLF